jgi:hypothetical protein
MPLVGVARSVRGTVVATVMVTLWAAMPPVEAVAVAVRTIGDPSNGTPTAKVPL